MTDETRVDRKARLVAGVVESDDLKAFYNTANRLRAMWGRLATVRLPLSETSLDFLLTAKEEAQNVVDAAESGEDIIRTLVLDAREAGDSLLVPIVDKMGAPTGNFSLGLDTHTKHFTVEHKERATVKVEEMLAALVRDGLLTFDQATTYRNAYTKHTEYDTVAFRARAAAAE